MNIRRDLTRLEKRGLVLRTRGGATLPAPLLYKSFQHERSIQGQQLQFAEQKRRIGLAASELIGERDRRIPDAMHRRDLQLECVIPHQSKCTIIQWGVFHQWTS
jgi:DeoR/GlpR family transcriptional regulator of sugar metabolism